MLVHNWKITVGDDETLVLRYPDDADPSTSTFDLEIRTVNDFTAGTDEDTLIDTIVPDVVTFEGELRDVVCLAPSSLTTTLSGPMWWALRRTITDNGQTETVAGGKVILDRTANRP